MSLQDEANSQLILLELLNDVLKISTVFSLEKCGTKSRKYVVYFDDILATGGTVADMMYASGCEKTEKDGKTNYEKNNKG